MSKTLTPITNLSVDTPITLIALANSLVGALGSEVVTVNTYSTGATTTGNGYVSGTFGASNLVAGQLGGGGVGSTANLNISTNTVVNSQSWITVGNTTINSTYINVVSLSVNNATISNFALSGISLGNTTISTVEVSTSGTSAQNIDSFSMTSKRSAEYLASIKNNSANGYQLTKLLMVHDGTTAYLTEYGVVSTNTGTPSIGTFGTTANATHAILQYTPVAASVTLRMTRIAIGV